MFNLRGCPPRSLNKTSRNQYTLSITYLSRLPFVRDACQSSVFNSPSATWLTLRYVIFRFQKTQIAPAFIPHYECLWPHAQLPFFHLVATFCKTDDLSHRSWMCKWSLGVLLLTHISLASLLWDLGKQCRPRSDAAERASYQGLHCLLTGISIRNQKWKVHQTTLKLEMDSSNWYGWTLPIDAPQIWVNRVCLIACDKEIGIVWIYLACLSYKNVHCTGVKPITVKFYVPWSRVFDVLKCQMTSSFSLRNAPDKHWRSIAKRYFAEALFSKLCIKIVFFTQNGGYYKAVDHSRNSQLRFPL